MVVFRCFEDLNCVRCHGGKLHPKETLLICLEKRTGTMGPPKIIVCGHRTFTGMAEARRAIRDEILFNQSHKGICRMLTPEEKDWVVPILNTHPHWKIKTKQNGGWTGEVMVNAFVGRGDNHLELCLKDGTTEVISYRKCLGEYSETGDGEALRRDLRKAVVDEIRCFSERNPVPSRCSCLRPLSMGPHSKIMVVDHRQGFAGRINII